ncbi:hypothetical protein B0H13DRAFT_1879267 [Mycena leptocephala]|nr:hypothetical protein B0H13DRAFT_1879267 [Mycena leptocephala]
MSSPRIAFLPFIPGDQPLSNGVSAIPNLDDAILGYDFHAQDASLDLLDTSTNTLALPALFPGADLSMESVEDIFADLHAVCAYQAPFDPLVLPSAPFRPWDPADVADTPPPSPTSWRGPGSEQLDAACMSLRQLTDAQSLQTEEGYEMLDQVARRFQAVRLAGAAHEDDESDSDESSSEEDYDGDAGDGGTDAQHTVDFEEASPSPAPSNSKPRVKAPAKHITAASPTPVTSGVGNSKKRKAKRAAGPRASKQRVVVRSTASSTQTFRMPVIPGITDAHLPPPPNSANIAPAFYYLLRLGCTVVGQGMKCYKCTQLTHNFADMRRHVAKHNRIYCQALCLGCPASFSREDAALRHMQLAKGHCSAPRRAFLTTFNELPVVVEMRANCNMEDTKAIGTMDKALIVLFENLFASTHPRKA